MASLVSAVSAPAYETRKRSNSTMPPPRLDAPATRAPFPSPTTPSRTSATAPQTTPTPAIAPASHLLHGGPDMPREFPPPGCVHRIAPEDARDKILMGICAALAHVENRALTPRQIVDVVHQAGIIKLGGNTPASTVSTHIRAHLARATSPLLLRHSLLPRPRRPETPTIEDCAVGPSPDGSSERKKGTAWYLSEAAGFASPWDRLGIPTPNEPESDNRPSPSPAPVPLPMESIDSQPQRVSSRKRTRTKSWSAAARELGMDGMTPAPEYDDESEAEAHRERKSKVRIRLRLGSLSTASRSSSVRPDDPPLLNPVEDDSDSEPPSNPSPTRNRVFSAPCPHLSRRSLSNSSSGGPSTPHALVFVDEDSDVEDGDFHVRMMCNSDSAPSSPRKPADQAPIVGIGLGLIFEGSDRGVKVKEESESSMSPPSLSSRASSLAASSLPEDDVWAVKIEEVEDVKMVVDLPPFDPPELCEVPLGFDIGTTYEGFEAEFAMLGVRSPTIIPHAFIREPDHVDGPESMRLDEVDRLWSDWGSGADKRAHTRTPRAARTSPLKRRDPAWAWGCRGAPGMRVSLNGARSRVCREGTPTGVVMQRERELTIERIVLHGIAYASCVIRGCVLLRRLEDAYVSLSSLLRACRVPGSCHAQFRTSGTVDVSIPPSDNDVSDAAEPTATETTTQAPKPQPTRNPSPSRTVPEPSDVLHTHNSSSDMVHPGTMPQGASIDFGTGVEAADVSGMWCPLAEARAVAEERLRPYLPEDIRLVFLGDGLEIKQPEPEPMEETKAELEETPSEPEANEPDADEPEMKTDADAESKTDADAESKIEADEPEQRDDTPSAPAPAREKVLAASDEDVSIFVRPSSPATVPCAARRVLRARPARVARTRTRA